MQRLPYVVPLGVLLRDRDGGEVRVGRDGWPRAGYRLSDYDLGHLRTGFDGAAQILEAAGARRIVAGHSRLVVYEPGRDGDRTRLLRDADACGWTAGRVVLFSFHLMSSARMGGSPATAACDPEGRVWGTRDLVVCDGSALPCAPGVNPMISIEAVAYLNAQALAARLR
jgi:choline dehydrogenase-like flavoprotein